MVPNGTSPIRVRWYNLYPEPKKKERRCSHGLQYVSLSYLCHSSKEVGKPYSGWVIISSEHKRNTNILPIQTMRPHFQHRWRPCQLHSQETPIDWAYYIRTPIDRYWSDQLRKAARPSRAPLTPDTRIRVFNLKFRQVRIYTRGISDAILASFSPWLG